jgi:hypothetical protein
VKTGYADCADTLEELHAFAARLGLRREWFQVRSTPHYDLTSGRAASATKLGAVTLDRRTFVRRLRANREVADAS